MTSNPSVDVVIPLYNKISTIRAAIESVFAQTYSPRSIIVVDDGSTDGSVDLVQRLNDPRIEIITQPNGGPGAARNRGLAASDATYVAFLDADDSWGPVFLSRCVEVLEGNPACAFCGSSWTSMPSGKSMVSMHNSQGIVSGVWRCPPEISAPNLKSAVDFCHSSAVLFRRSMVLRFRGYYDKDRCTFGEDSYLFLRILLNYPIFRLVEPLIFFRTDTSELGFGRKTAHPEPPLLKHVDAVASECPSEYRACLDRYVAYYALFVGARMIKEGLPRQGLAYLWRRVPLQDLRLQHWWRYIRAFASGLVLTLKPGRR
jgi:glycosyltransferase involved in cell wall biosynthesis